MKKIVLFLAMASLFSCKQSEEKMISTKETSSENEKRAKGAHLIREPLP